MEFRQGTGPPTPRVRHTIYGMGGERVSELSLDEAPGARTPLRVLQSINAQARETAAGKGRATIFE